MSDSSSPSPSPLPTHYSPPQLLPPPITPPGINMRVCSRNPGARRVSGADGTPRKPSPSSREHARHRPSSYHYDSRNDSRGDRFYNLQDLPPLEVVSQCFSGFIRGTSTLLYILPEYEAIELINAIYHPGAGQSKATNSEFCELLAIAAIGSQYEDIGQDTQLGLFKSAKWYLDSSFEKEEDIFRKMRVSMLVGLFFVFEKSFWARDYLDQAIEHGRNRGLNGVQRHPSYSEREWASWKRVWGSLVFLDGWLSGSLGSIPTICEGNDPIYTEGYRTCTNDLDAYLHAEMIKLSILIGSITKDVYTAESIDFSKVKVYSTKLKAWHTSLPESLRLHRAVSGNDSRQRSTILLAHCCYLSSIILLTRRIFVERFEGTEGLDELARVAMADEYIRIQAAYTASLVILLCLSTGDIEDSNADDSPDAQDQDQDLIFKCLSTLEVCAVYDLVAQRFLDILNSIRRSLMVSKNSNHQQVGSKRRLDNVTPTDEGRHSPTYFSYSVQLTRHILDIFRQPFGGESKIIRQDDYTLSKFFPENWRFLVPEPPSEAGFSAPSHGTTPDSTPGVSSSENDRRDSKKPRGPPRFRTKEEYEAFFRRIS